MPSTEKTYQCVRCAETIPGRGGVQKYCSACRVRVSRELNKGYEAAKRRRAGVPAIGATISCEDCYADTVKVNSAQTCCPSCADLRHKICHRASNKKYDSARPPRLRSPDYLRERARRYKQKHPELIRQRSFEYNERNRELINRKSREFRKTEHRKEWLRRWEEKRRGNPKVVVNTRMRTTVRLALKGKKSGRSWRKVLTFSLDELMRHLERQFLPGMSWDNIGSWHIDHIVPLKSFNYESESDPDFRAAWALTNLRPLWDVDNYSKGARRLFLI